MRWRSLAKLAIVVVLGGVIPLGSVAQAGASTTLGIGAASTACSLASTNGTVTRFVAGRPYLLHAPAGLSGPAVPLLLSMHPLTFTASQQESSTGWSGFADSNNFIVAYPQGIWNAWNYSAGSYDVTYLRNVVSDIHGTWCVDSKRIFSDGWSAGAVMSMRLACDAADVFAASVEWAGESPTMNNQPCNPSRPMPVGLFHGDADNIAPISADQANRDEWIARNHCSTTPAHATDPYGTTDTYTGCSAGVAVLWRVLAGQDHFWPTGAKAADQRNRMWSFLTAYPHP
jgi:polyhydroxybutyrate depolymerase